MTASKTELFNPFYNNKIPYFEDKYWHEPINDYFYRMFKIPLDNYAWRTKEPSKEYLTNVQSKIYVMGRMGELISYIKAQPMAEQTIPLRTSVLQRLTTYKEEMDNAFDKIYLAVEKAIKTLSYLDERQARGVAKDIFPNYFSHLFFKMQKDKESFPQKLAYFLVNEKPELLSLHLETLFAVEEIINSYIPKFVMMVGIAGAGKTTASSDYLEESKQASLETVLISSDTIREHYGISQDDRSQNAFIFGQMELETIKALEERKNVIYDATNIHRDKRMKLLGLLPKETYKVVIYLATPYQVIEAQNRERENPVPEYVLDSMYRTMQIPIMEEGWDKVLVEHHDTTIESELQKPYTEAIRAEVLFNRDGYELILFLAQAFIEFNRVFDMPHDTPEHNLSASRHAYHTYRTILKTYKPNEEVSLDREIMLWASLCLNIGKPFAKDFTNEKGEERRFATYKGYENISSQMVIPFLHRMNISEDVALEVAKLIHFYQFAKRYRKANKEKIINMVGEDTYEKLIFLRNASKKNKVNK